MGLNTTAVKLILSRTALPDAVFTAGCATTNDEPLGGAPSFGVGQAAQLGNAAQVGSSTIGATVRFNNAVILAKYEASAIQRKIAEERAKKAYQKMPVAHKTALKKAKVRYIAVDTQKDARIKGQKAVMIWDTQAESLVGNSVYDVQSTPAVDSPVKFETFASEYVGSGS